MDEPRSLDSLFKEKLLRIPDYQRGYAWRREQLEDFWEDLVNLPEGRSHYTGVLTLKEIPASQVAQDAREFWRRLHFHLMQPSIQRSRRRLACLHQLADNLRSPVAVCAKRAFSRTD